MQYVTAITYWIVPFVNWVSHLFAGHPIEICMEPLAVAYTPNSILDLNPSKDTIRYAGDRPRYSTCSGACWLKDDKHLLCVNMQACSFNIYSFDPNEQTLLPKDFFDNTKGTELARPESVDISTNGEFIVAANATSGRLNFYQVFANKTIHPIPIKKISSKSLHGVRLTPDNRFVALSSLSEDRNGGINIYSIESKKFRLVQNFKHPSLPMKVKSIDFSHDGRFIVIGSCIQLSHQIHRPKGTIAVHKFNAKTGMIDPKPICKTDNIISVETLSFHPSGKAFFAVDQVTDKVFGFEFDQSNGQIGKQWAALENPTAKLSIPHGIAFSHSGKYVAVTSYGDDKVCIYKVFTP